MQLGKVSVSPAFLLLAAWLNFWDGQGLLPRAALSCLLHEAGHLAVLRCFGHPTQHIRLGLTGAEIQVDGLLSYEQEMLAALAGPLVNLAAAWLAVQYWDDVLFAGVNLALACLNLLPVSRLDGGRALLALTARLLGLQRAESLCAVLDQGLMAALILLGALFLWQAGNVTLLLVALWLLPKKRKRNWKNGTCQGGGKRVQ